MLTPCDLAEDETLSRLGLHSLSGVDDQKHEVDDLSAADDSSNE
jgi:hypothetical protein